MLKPGSFEETPPPAKGMMVKFDYSHEFLAPTRPAARRAAASDFGWPVFDFALRLAIVYPALSLFLSGTSQAKRG